jgi:hypothetical protein
MLMRGAFQYAPRISIWAAHNRFVTGLKPF